MKIMKHHKKYPGEEEAKRLELEREYSKSRYDWYQLYPTSTNATEEHTHMISTKHRVVWTDSTDVVHDISKMSDDYVTNCLVFCQRRKKTLEEVEYKSRAVCDLIQDMNDSIEQFVCELNYRRKKHITISREEGCEDNNRAKVGAGIFGI